MSYGCFNFFGCGGILKIKKKITKADRKMPILGGAASQYTGLPTRQSVCLPACLSVPVSFWRSFVDYTNVYHCLGVFIYYPGPKNEQCHTQTV